MVSSFAQEEGQDLDIESDDPIVQASRFINPRPKILELEYQFARNIEAGSTSDLFGDADATIRENLIRGIKLKFPIALKEGLQVFGGFKYVHEQFTFRDVQNLDYDLYERLEDRPLKRVGFTVFLKKDLDDDRFLFAFADQSLNSDDPRFQNIGGQFKTTVSVIFGKNPNPHKQVAFGGAIGYNFGRASIFPLFIYKYSFNQHLALEMLLPKTVKFRYSPNIKTHLWAYVDLTGASYRLQDELLTGFDQLELRRSAATFNFSVEREIYDFLWFGITTGLSQPLNVFVSEPRKRSRDSLVDINPDPTQFFKFSLFLVPPRNLMNRAKGR